MSAINFTKSASKTYYTVDLLGEQVGTIQLANPALKTWSVVINGKTAKNNAGDTEFTFADAKARATQHAKGLLLRSLQPLSRVAVVAVNRAFRESDESHKWPINGRFNATERAIRRVRHYRSHGWVINTVAEYMAALKTEISYIVNNEV